MTEDGDTRTPAQIEADIKRKREELARTLEEIAVRAHPQTIKDHARVRISAAVDRSAGRAYVAVNRAVTDLRAQFLDEDGSPRMERVVPVAAAAVLLVALVRTRRRR
ncbi:hypothetical protein AQ490_05015 [Wenjunlia vitaminophila]|uniref:DUF3618 domain-containing protein n=1 Tax=Wenjunlia vitaminophila TaxID=76728 RepID=A0A0T6LNR0_WENVI|nr:DUF3618 domain-containing protein [Wenjunlia vitaminophila]KRV47742.1 hypothetical protein AQ490_05015 [Wenjunlia vitaminophila]